MDKNRELARNTIIFGIGAIGAKLMQFILIPLYTLYLTTAEYSTADIVHSTVTMLIPFLTLGMGHGVLRFVIGKRKNQKPLLQFSIIICLISSCILVCTIPLFRMTNLFAGYEYMIPILFLTSSLRTVLSSYCKAIDKNRAYAFDGIVSATTTALLSIVFLRFLHYGVLGYLWAYAIGQSISDIYYFFVCNVLKTLHKKTDSNKVVRDALKYSVPLMPNDLAWWIIQLSDRYMITWTWGSALNGIYSMAYKIPGIFNLIVSIFIQALNITTFKEFDNSQGAGKYDGKYFQKIYEKYLAISFCAVIIVILFTQPIAYILIKKEFYESWKYTSFLLIAFLIGNLEAFLGSILGGIKKTQISFISTSTGAVVNIILNAILISKYKAYGAIIATVVAYYIVYFIRYLGVRKYVEMDLHHMKSVISIMLVLIASLCYVNPYLYIKLGSFCVFLVIVQLYRKDICEISKIAIHRIYKKM